MKNNYSVALLIIDSYDENNFAKLAIYNSLNIPHLKNIYTIGKKKIIDGAVHFYYNDNITIDIYNNIILNHIHNFIKEDYCLIIQWDGFVINPNQWNNDFLDYDFIGAPWSDTEIGNGGFSLRSKRLITKVAELAALPSKYEGIPEDIVICRLFKQALENDGNKFAPIPLAQKFSFENFHKSNTLGFHGVFNLPKVLDEEFLYTNSAELFTRTKNILFISNLLINAYNLNMFDFIEKYTHLLSHDNEVHAKLIIIFNQLNYIYLADKLIANC